MNGRGIRARMLITSMLTSMGFAYLRHNILAWVRPSQNAISTKDAPKATRKPRGKVKKIEAPITAIPDHFQSLLTPVTANPQKREALIHRE
jgi:hypothetical protein